VKYLPAAIVGLGVCVAVSLGVYYINGLMMLGLFALNIIPRLMPKNTP